MQSGCNERSCRGSFYSMIQCFPWLMRDIAFNLIKRVFATGRIDSYTEAVAGGDLEELVPADENYATR
jgi:hypothetical protein